MKARTTEILGWFARGLAMGIADMVPGISGGTMALVTGIYQRLIAAIAAVNARFLMLVLRGHWPTAWRQVDGNFLASLLTGILIAIVLMSHIVLWLFANAPVLIWGFFMGLLLLAVWFMGRSVNWTARALAVAVLAAAIALSTVFGGSVAIEPTLPWLFVGGMIAITAMILPGISGSLILLMLGLYAPAVEAVRTFDFTVIAVIASGCLTGILIFSRLLNWLLQRFENLALAGMTGIVAGAMLRLWPWQHMEPGSAALNLAWPVGIQALGQGIAAMLCGMAVYLLLHRWRI